MSKPREEKKFQVPVVAIKELLTTSELRMLANRWQIINLLEEGLSIRAVAQKLKVGTDTVVRVSRMMHKENLREILDQKKPAPAKTSWVFGKSE